MRAQGRWAEERGGGEAEGAATADDLSTSRTSQEGGLGMWRKKPVGSRGGNVCVVQGI